MRDALGGIVNIQMIIVFLVLINGYLAFSVNYTKAFRVKNKIITAIEQYEGNVEAASEINGDLYCYIVGSCEDKPGVGYHPTNYRCPAGFTDAPNQLGFCYQERNVGEDTTDTHSGVTSTLEKKQYRVVTFVTIDIPIVRFIIERVNPFNIKGDTKTIYKRKES